IAGFGESVTAQSGRKRQGDMNDQSVLNATAHADGGSHAADVNRFGDLFPFCAAVVVAGHKSWNVQFESLTSSRRRSGLLRNFRVGAALLAKNADVLCL